MLATLWHYWRTRRLSFRHRDDLEAYQQKKLQQFAQRVLKKSPYFAPYIDKSLAEYPLMNKMIMMDNFDKMNTAGLSSTKLLECAQRSEQSRDFKPQVGKFSVGLSSGTSGSRGVFVVSPKEQDMWAGVILAKMLPDSLFSGEKIALFLRANNNLYESINNRWLSFRFYDLMDDFQQQVAALEAYQPTIIVAPAQVLCAIAKKQLLGEIHLTAKKVISVAEVLNQQDKDYLTQCFPSVGEIYQATEGFLGCTCSYGTLHLNEAFLYIEPEWHDETRFSPIITDFTRETQPIVRYRLDDILVARQTPCPCGDPQMAIERIEGRCDDQLQLKDQLGNPLVIFADPCSRIIANQLPLNADFRLTQQGNHFTLQGECDTAILTQCQNELMAYFAKQGAQLGNISWALESTTIDLPFITKRRRITQLAPVNL